VHVNEPGVCGVCAITVVGSKPNGTESHGRKDGRETGGDEEPARRLRLLLPLLRVPYSARRPLLPPEH
jgi:hypothetical protein